MEKDLTCIICPRGCQIKIKMDGDSITEITGNTCKRGEEYARNEMTNPVRTLTSTIAINGGGVVSVKTDKPIPKDKMFECMEEINKKVINKPIIVGQILIENLLNTGANVVATQNLE